MARSAGLALPEGDTAVPNFIAKLWKIVEHPSNRALISWSDVSGSTN